MEKKSCSVNLNPRVEDIFKHLRSDLQVGKRPKLSVDLRIRKEAIFWKYKGESFSQADSDDYWKNLGYGKGVPRDLCVRNNALFSLGALQTQGRRWYKDAMTEEDQRASVYMPKEEKKEDDADRVIAKELLHQFLKQAKARTRMAGTKGKKVDEKKIRSASAPYRGK